ncbi:MAG: proline--tRNA ligase, partial [Coriobacteriales bacterium]|nr:proline--tRNA ligase [Coriobacteriales bacterium]
EHGFALSPTHEELITALVRNELRSYRELPRTLYHFSNKYRDEIRPRFGLLRAREFIMKDAYSFHSDQASLDATYAEQAQAYGRICQRLGLDFYPVEADSGQIGGKVTTEFMALAEAGEAELVYCECGYAANTEIAAAGIEVLQYKPEEATSRQRIHTPIEGTIAALAEFLGVPEQATVKALAGRDANGQLSVLFIPGSHTLGDVKVERAIPGFSFLSDEEIANASLVKGYMGPVDLPAGIKVIADVSLRDLPRWVTGANERDYHYTGIAPGEDFTVDDWFDLSVAQAGDACPRCGRALKAARGIEVGQVFQLGTRYSEAMAASYMDQDGAEKPFLMGCYGWGVTRSLAAVVEQHNDEKGIIWPISVAPAEVCVIALSIGDELVHPQAEALAQSLAEAGLEVVLDDRDERAGVKFNDADLIGWPYQLIVGKRGLEAGIVELKTRASAERRELPLDNARDIVTKLVVEQRAVYRCGSSDFPTT